MRRTATAGAIVIGHRTTCALAALITFVIEAGIAAFVHDTVVRPWLGDSLAVALLYLAIRAMTPLGMRWSVAIALAIACAIEVGQAAGLVDILGLRHCRLARLILGSAFDPWDFLAYAGGAVAMIVAEAALRARLAPAMGAA